MALIGLVQQDSSSYQESKDRVAGVEAELRAVMPPTLVAAALAHGQARELWTTVAELRDGSM